MSAKFPRGGGRTFFSSKSIICYIENAGLALDNYKIEKIVQLYTFKTSDYG